VAAGLATMGLIPYISTFVSFAVVRPLDQVRVLIAQTGLPVKITPGYAGLFTGMAGKTHQIVDDVSIMRAMPGMVTVSPADDVEAREVLRWAAAYEGPCYVRLVRDATQRLFGDGYRFEFGKAVQVRPGTDVTIFSTARRRPASSTLRNSSPRTASTST
jgi:transketolase